MAEYSNNWKITNASGKALFEALNTDNIELATLLLQRGADPNEILPVEGVAPIHIATGLGEDFIKLLLTYGGNPNVRSADGTTPLHVAASWGDSDCLQLLLLNGGDPFIKDREGLSVMDTAKSYNHRGCMALLEYYFLLLNPVDDLSSSPRYTYDIQSRISEPREIKVLSPRHLNDFSHHTNCNYEEEFQRCLSGVKQLDMAAKAKNRNTVCLNVTSPDHPMISQKRMPLPVDDSLHVRWADKLTETLPISMLRDDSHKTDSSSDTFITCSGDENEQPNKFFTDYLHSNNDTYTIDKDTVLNSVKDCTNNAYSCTNEVNCKTSECHKPETKINQHTCANSANSRTSEHQKLEPQPNLHTWKKSTNNRLNFSDSLISSDFSFIEKNIQSKRDNITSQQNRCRFQDDSTVFDDYQFEEFDSIITDDGRTSKKNTFTDKNVNLELKSSNTQKNESPSRKEVLAQNVDKTFLIDRLFNRSSSKLDSVRSSASSCQNDVLNNSFICRKSLESNVSDASTIDLIYTDKEFGIQFIERHLPSLQGSSGRQSLSSVSSASTVDSQQTIMYDWKCYTDTSSCSEGEDGKTNAPTIPPHISQLNNQELRQELLAKGDNPGPITDKTRYLYLVRLTRINADPDYLNRCQAQPEYSAELRASLNNWDPTGLRELEEAFQASFEKTDRLWREGRMKSSFNYLLLDPRVTKNLPNKIHSMGEQEAFKVFVSAIFYIGKGKRSRPYCHLYEALRQMENPKDQVCPKVKHILDIWKGNMGVVSLHCFQNTIAAEAYTREAAMIDAISMSRLTNKKRGDYYGIAATWLPKQKRQIGVYFLRKAMTIFQGEGERQILPMDIKVGQ